MLLVPPPLCPPPQLLHSLCVMTRREGRRRGACARGIAREAREERSGFPVALPGSGGPVGGAEAHNVIVGSEGPVALRAGVPRFLRREGRPRVHPPPFLCIHNLCVITSCVVLAALAGEGARVEGSEGHPTRLVKHPSSRLVKQVPGGSPRPSEDRPLRREALGFGVWGFWGLGFGVTLKPRVG